MSRIRSRSAGLFVVLVVALGWGAVACRTSEKGIANMDGGRRDGPPGPADGPGREMAPSECTQPVGERRPNGMACSCGGECITGYCVDGVCCNSACGGNCQQCNLASSRGQCSPTPAGQAPVVPGQCPKGAMGSCGNDGTCDGAGGCRKELDGSVCGAGSCQGSTVVGGKICQGGSCVAGPETICAPYACDGSAGKCFAACTSNTQCDGRECKDGSCGTKPLGAVCTASTECDSGFCVDGVCCNVACTGACASCNQAGRMGECAPVPVGSPDPHGVCLAEPLGTCGTNGLCNGLGGCALYAQGTECKASTCASGSELPMSICDGNGTCLVGAAIPCAPYVCGTTTCKISCTSNADCAGSNVCVDGSCGKKPLGQRCAAAGECESNFCVEGYCCESGCTGTCVTCASPRARGRCTNVAAGAVDPRGECQDQGPASCGRNGRCNGNRGCQTYPTGTPCRAASCNSQTNLFTQQATCRNGSCTAPAATSCAPFRCNGAACGNTCSSNNQCAPPNVCQDRSCGKKPLGAFCSRGDECQSSFCADGVCCGSACSGLCQSCNQAGMAGTCAPVAAGTTDSGCPAQAMNTCGNTGTCNGSGACTKWGTSVTCAAATCSNGTATTAGFCSGSGACTPGSSRACAPYVCNGATANCHTSCVTNAECASPSVCVNGLCTGKLGNGGSCARNDQCESNQCVEGVCCNTACTESCKSCSLDSARGTCTNVPAGADDPKNACAPDPGNVCGNTNKCNGSGACQKAPTTVPCRSASCSAGTLTMSANCNGNGACPAPVTMACATGACDGDACQAAKPNGQACSAGNECTSGNCVDGVCCNDDCTGACRACNLSGSQGTCTPVSTGADPLCTGGSGPCAATGMCGAGGTCELPGNSTSCGTTCPTPGNQLVQRRCNGAGQCVDGPTTTCDNDLVCGGANACLTTCTDTNDCTAGKVCNTTTGMCVPPPDPDAGM